MPECFFTSTWNPGSDDLFVSLHHLLILFRIVGNTRPLREPIALARQGLMRIRAAKIGQFVFVVAIMPQGLDGLVVIAVGDGFVIDFRGGV